MIFSVNELIFDEKEDVMGMINQDNYINLDEAAKYLGIKPTTLRSWIKDPKNEVPAHKVGRMWKFKRSEIDVWVNSGKRA